MKTLIAILSKGPDDFGAWFENFGGVYGAGGTPAEAKRNLLEGLDLYALHNHNVPLWIRKKSYKITYKVHPTTPA